MTEIRFEGVERYAATAHRAADDLRDLTAANREAAQKILDAARPPRVSGDLERSGRVISDAETATVGYDAAYAGVIYGGWADRNIDPQPWLDTAVDQAERAVVDVYSDEIDQILSTIEGA